MVVLALEQYNTWLNGTIDNREAQLDYAEHMYDLMIRARWLIENPTDANIDWAADDPAFKEFRDDTYNDLEGEYECWGDDNWPRIDGMSDVNRFTNSWLKP
jgi:hypothetical protein